VCFQPSRNKYIHGTYLIVDLLAYMDKQKARISIDYAKCAPCSAATCMGVCPEGILEPDLNKKPKVSDEAQCTICGVCADLCPTKAITLTQKKSTK
jgi:NAD-dependent dihydropyrimidine dehydrogenase PreA subunit